MLFNFFLFFDAAKRGNIFSALWIRKRPIASPALFGFVTQFFSLCDELGKKQISLLSFQIVISREKSFYIVKDITIQIIPDVEKLRWQLGVLWSGLAWYVLVLCDVTVNLL